MAEHHQVLLSRFAEPESRVQNDTLVRHACGLRRLRTPSQAGPYLLNQVAVVGALLVVHEHQVGTVLRRYVGYLRVPFQPPDVVDHGDACLQGLSRHLRLIGIYADWNGCPRHQRFQQRHQPRQLFRSGERDVSRPSGLRSHVQDIGPLRLKARG